MRVLLTGCRGKVGRATALALKQAGHTVLGTDLFRGSFDAPSPDDPLTSYTRADLQDAGQVFGMVAQLKPDAVAHVGAIPEPSKDVGHVVFQNNLMATFNVVEACVRLGVKRLVNISSETVPGFFFPGMDYQRTCLKTEQIPEYCPVDEKHSIRPTCPYALSKLFGEQLCDAALRRKPDFEVCSIRPSWCQHAGNIEQNLGPFVRDLSKHQPGMWSYILTSDLANAITLACTAALPKGKHEVMYIANDDNIGGRDLKTAVEQAYEGRVPVRALSRPDASGIDCSKAKRILGWAPKHSWRDYLDANGCLLPKWKTGTNAATSHPARL